MVDVISNDEFEAIPMGKDVVVIGGDGTAERYGDPFANVTAEHVEKAESLQTQIIEHQKRVDVAYIKMARDLSIFKNESLYLAMGYTNFKEWASSPELASVGYRTAYNLVRIADHVLPLLQDNNLLNEMPPISNLYDLLPILNDEDGEAKFLKAMKAIKGLTNREAKSAIKEIRGIEPQVGERTPTMFTCKVTPKEGYNEVEIFSSDNVDYYLAGTVRIALKDWARWENLFGETNITFKE